MAHSSCSRWETLRQSLIAIAPAIAAILAPLFLMAAFSLASDDRPAAIEEGSFTISAVDGSPCAVSRLRIAFQRGNYRDGEATFACDTGMGHGILSIVWTDPIDRADYDEFRSSLAALCEQSGYSCVVQSIRIDNSSDLFAITFWAILGLLVIVAATKYIRGATPALSSIRLRNRALAVLATALAAFVVLSLVGSLSLLWHDPPERLHLGDAASINLILIALIPVLVAPVLEEFLYRAWPLSHAIKHGLRPGIVAVGASALFALSHWNPAAPHVVIGVFLAGLIFSRLFLYSRSWRDCVLAHGLCNLAILTARYLT